MKTYFKYLVAGLMLPAIFSCQNNKYELSGTIEGAQDGDSVFVARLNSNGWNPCDTVVINNGKFLIEGQADSCDIYSFWLDNEHASFQGFFFGEPGKITFEVKQNKTQQNGTKLNNIYQQTLDSLYAISDRMGELYQTADPSSEETMKKAEALNKEIQELIKTQVVANSDNQVGFFLLITNASMLQPEDIEVLINGLSENIKQHPIVQDIASSVQKMKMSAVGQPYLDFELKDTKGKSFKISDIIGKNKITVLDFWSSWCGPCMMEMPEMVKIYNEFKGKGVEFIGISLDTDENAWKSAIKNKNMTWPQGAELTDWGNNQGAQLYNVEAIPFTVIVSKDGKILAKGLRSGEIKSYLEENL